MFAWGCFHPQPPLTTFVLSVTPVVPAVSADSAAPECTCSHTVSEKERFGNSGCCLCPRGLGEHWLGCSSCGRLTATCSFLLVTPNTSPDQDIYFSRSPSDDISYWDWKMRLQRRSSNGKATGSPPEPHSPFHRVEINFPLLYTNGKSVQENKICLFRWKNRTGCSTPLWGVTTYSHFHQPLCTWDLYA